MSVVAPTEAVAKVQLFLIDPVEGPIDDGLATVGCEECDFTATEVLDIEVVFANISNLGARRSELGELERRGCCIAPPSWRSS